MCTLIRSSAVLSLLVALLNICMTCTGLPEYATRFSKFLLTYSKAADTFRPDFPPQHSSLDELPVSEHPNWVHDKWQVQRMSINGSWEHSKAVREIVSLLIGVEAMLPSEIPLGLPTELDGRAIDRRRRMSAEIPLNSKGSELLGIPNTRIRQSNSSEQASSMMAMRSNLVMAESPGKKSVPS
jgi:hypothetical protein